MNAAQRTDAGKRLLVVDDHCLFLQAVRSLFGSSGITVHAAPTAPEALSACEEHPPDVVVISLNLPDDAAWELGEELRRRCTLRLVYLDDAPYPLNAQAAFQEGAHGYWTKQSDFDAFQGALGRVFAGGYAVCPKLAPYLTASARGTHLLAPAAMKPLADLSCRELQVFRHLARGANTTRCARRLHLAKATVENHKTRLMRKLGLHRHVDLMLLALKQGLLKR